MAPVKNNKGKAQVTDGPASRTRAAVARNQNQAQAAEALPSPTRTSSRLRSPRTAPNANAPASPPRVRRRQNLSAAASAQARGPQRRLARVQAPRPIRLVLTSPKGGPERSANSATADPEEAPSTPPRPSTAVSQDIPTSQRLILRKPKLPVAGPEKNRPGINQERLRELRAWLNLITLPNPDPGFAEVQHQLESLFEALTEFRQSREELQEVYEDLKQLGEEVLAATGTATRSPSVDIPRVRTLRRTTERIRAQRAVVQGTPKKKTPRSRVRKTPSPKKKKTSPTRRQAMAEAEQEQDTMTRNRVEDESNAIESLIQLSQNAPIVFERNREDDSNSNDHEPPGSQPWTQPGPVQDMSADPNHGTVQLQAYLYRQQRLVGIPPERMISMSGEMGAHVRGKSSGQVTPQGPVNRPENPSVVQFSSEGGVVAPVIPPAQYQCELPFLIFTPDLPANEQSAADNLDMLEEIYGPGGSPDRQEERAIPVGDSLDESIDHQTWLANNDQAQTTEGNLVSSPEDPGTPGAMGLQSLDNMEAEQGESLDEPMKETGPVQNQHRNSTRTQRILPNTARDSPHRRSSNTARAARAPRNRPPKPTYNHAHNGFDILGALSNNLEIAFLLTEYLEPTDLFNLYACSKDWNGLITSTLEAIILKQAIQHAPESARAFPFRCYPHLRKLNPGSKNELVPSFPWLFMITDRERIVQSIMQWMRRTSYAVPAGSGIAIKKLWFLMDIPDTKRRKWTIRTWSDMDLFLAGLFMMQIDSALQDEDEAGSGLGAMRRLLMAQKSLSVLWDVLSGETWQSELELVQSYIRWRYEPRPHERDMQNILGVPIEEVGLLQYEAYGRHGRTAKVRRPDTIVISELKNRELDIRKMYWEALALDEEEPHMGDDRPRWDMALKDAIEGTGIDWLNAVNLNRPKIC
ncbi:uncharacterized protein KD926_006464 [Aspergillus affinis]|uniref:uncharacterized protein n=1 Tax=Aspergillus affinis TaxID=1070780 RepID=UPI0022FEAB44|nr:uncharacterized protein KD926_006464 [Aspergillus affinis]KAI9041740.1 hypothetical protein KD926_006464 [Aspergillus affinis]